MPDNCCLTIKTYSEMPFRRFAAIEAILKNKADALFRFRRHQGRGVLTAVLFASVSVAFAKDAPPGHAFALGLRPCTETGYVAPRIEGYTVARIDKVDWTGDGVCDAMVRYRPTAKAAQSKTVEYRLILAELNKDGVARAYSTIENVSAKSIAQGAQALTVLQAPDMRWLSDSNGEIYAEVRREDMSGDRIADELTGKWALYHYANHVWQEVKEEDADASGWTSRARLAVDRLLPEVRNKIRKGKPETLIALLESISAKVIDPRIERALSLAYLQKSDTAAAHRQAERVLMLPTANMADLARLYALMDARREPLLAQYMAGLLRSTPIGNATPTQDHLLAVLNATSAVSTRLSEDAVRGYFMRKNFNVGYVALDARGQQWQVGTAALGVVARRGNEYRVLSDAEVWSYLDTIAPALANTAPDNASAARNNPARPPIENTAYAGHFDIRAEPGRRSFSGSVATGDGTSTQDMTLETACELEDIGPYFELSCHGDYAGGAHPDHFDNAKEYFSKSPQHFLEKTTPEMVCTGAHYDQKALDQAWEQQLVSCAQEIDGQETDGTSNKKMAAAEFRQWLMKGKEIVGDKSPRCEWVDKSDGKLQVVASTGAIARIYRGTSCDQTAVSVPINNEAAYIDTHSGRSYAEMLAAHPELAKLDKELNEVFRQWVSSLAAKDGKQAVLQQRRWISARDTKAGNAGAAGSNAYVDTLQRLTKARIAELRPRACSSQKRRSALTGAENASAARSKDFCAPGR